MKPKLYPIEVKSGKRCTTDSLDLLLRKYHQRIDRAYIVHTKKSCGKRRDRLHSRLYGDPSLIIEPWQYKYKK